MRIAQICPYDIDRPGGVQFHIRDTAAALAERGHDVAIIAPKVAGNDGVAAPANVRILRFGRAHAIRFAGTAFEISAAVGAERQALSSFLQNSKFDVLHYHTMWTPFLPLQIFVLSEGANVATFHDTPPDSVTGACLNFVFRGLSHVLLPRLDASIAVSEAPAKHLRGASAQSLHIHPPCVDLGPFFAVPSVARDANRPLSILFLGRLEPRKGAMVLLEAYQRLRSDGRALCLTIAGTGPEEKKLRRYVAQNKLPDVQFLGSFPTDGAANLYASCDIFCAPSLSGESFGIVIAQAMASGRPVIAASNPGYRTVLTGEGAQMLVDPGNSEALYGALARLAEDTSLRNSLALWGRTNAMQYDCRTVVPRLLAIYERAVGSRKR